MTSAAVIEALTTIVKMQADIIQAQAEALAQVGAVVMEDERVAAAQRWAELVGGYM